MKPKTTWHGIFALITLLGFSSLCAAENARLPYEQIYKMQRIQAKWKISQTNLQVVIRMNSTLPNVKASDLKVFVETKKGNLPVKVDDDGTFSVPMKDDLLAENPFIVVNQPKGTMALHWDVRFVNVVEFKNPLKYRRLFGSLSDAEDLQDEMLRAFPGQQRLTFAGLKMTFSDAEERAVVIHANVGDQKLKLDSDHQVTITRQPGLIQENPEVSLPSRPVKIEFAVHKKEG